MKSKEQCTQSPALICDLPFNLRVGMSSARCKPVYVRVCVCVSTLFTKEIRYSASSVWSNIVALEK